MHLAPFDTEITGSIVNGVSRFTLRRSPQNSFRTKVLDPLHKSEHTRVLDSLRKSEHTRVLDSLRKSEHTRVLDSLRKSEHTTTAGAAEDQRFRCPGIGNGTTYVILYSEQLPGMHLYNCCSSYFAKAASFFAFASRYSGAYFSTFVRITRIRIITPKIAPIYV